MHVIHLPSAVFITAIAEFFESMVLHFSQKIESLQVMQLSEHETGLHMIDTPSLTGSLPIGHLSLHLKFKSITKLGKLQEVHFNAESLYSSPIKSQLRQSLGQLRH